MRAATLLTALLPLLGCEQVEPTIHDQCLRNDIFMRCMAALPPGPEQTKYNDWAEVIDSCEDAAMWQSYRKESMVKPECR